MFEVLQSYENEDKGIAYHVGVLQVGHEGGTVQMRQTRISSSIGSKKIQWWKIRSTQHVHA